MDAHGPSSLGRCRGIELHHSRGWWGRLTTHTALGALATLPVFQCWYQLHAIHRQPSLLTAFGSFVIINSIGGALYATSILDNVIGKELGMPDASHHAMHVIVVFGAWKYQQSLLAAYQANTNGSAGLCG